MLGGALNSPTAQFYHRRGNFLLAQRQEPQISRAPLLQNRPAKKWHATRPPLVRHTCRCETSVGQTIKQAVAELTAMWVHAGQQWGAPRKPGQRQTETGLRPPKVAGRNRIC